MKIVSTYYGLHHDGRARLSHAGQHYLFCGTVAKQNEDAIGRLVFDLSKAVKVSPSASASARQSNDNSIAIEVVARGVKSGKLYLLRGQVVTARKKSTATASRKRKQRRALSSDEYEIDVQRVKAAQNADVDAMVSLPFILAHTSRAAATVYRHIKAGALPAPSKVGRASVWPFSAVDAYARGTAPTQQAPTNNIEAAIALPQNIVKESK